MNPDRWSKIDGLLQAALERAPEERDEFLARECADDEALRQEVLSLLESHGQAGAFLEEPAMNQAARDIAEEDTLAGRTVAHYRILEKLGAGGMGIVYAAQDTRLDRKAALKFLPDESARDPQVRTRFQREARAASALNHPNICTIYDIGEYEGRPYLAMEYLEGSDLRDYMSGRRLSLDEALALAIEIAGALDAAHSAGIVHRDIKPANVFITRQSHVKLLDFGLAQLQHPQGESAALTASGIAVGTYGYMSPEQMQGKPVDARTDLYSLGMVLYEMAAGAPLVPGARFANDIPPRLTRVIAKCLETDRDLRYQHASEIRTDLERLRIAPSAKPARSWKVALIAGAALAALAASFALLRGTPKLTDKDTIVLADFENRTGDNVFDGTLREALAIELGQSPFLSIVSDRRIQETLALMNQPKDAHLTPQLSREICERTGGAAVMEGSLTPLGTQYVVTLRARSCRDGDVLAEEQAQAGRKEDVLNKLSQISRKLRARVGESLSTVQQHGVPLPEATTPSLDALKAYSEGKKVAHTLGESASVPLYKRALEIDPQFATAYASLGLAYSDTGDSILSLENTRKAYEFRIRASDRERFFLALTYDRQVTGNLERALETLDVWRHTYPRDVDAHGLSSGFAPHGTGKYEMAIEQARIAISLDPSFSPPYLNLATAAIYLERLPEAQDALDRGTARNPQFPDFLVMHYQLAFLKNDQAAMDRAARGAIGKVGAEDWLLHLQSLVAARSGRLQASRKLANQAVEVAQRAESRGRAGLFTAAPSIWEALSGNLASARERAHDALGFSRSRDIEYASAFALSLAGDGRTARTLTDDLDKRFPEDTVVRFTYLPALRALAALQRGDPGGAIELLRPASRYELAVPFIAFSGFYGAMHPVYLRGKAYMALGRETEAAAEFQKIVDHPGLMMGDPLGAIARLEVGRALALSGEKGKARAAYQKFFTIWKDADPDVPLLHAARAEFAKL